MPRCYRSALISEEFLHEPKVIKTVNHLIDGSYSSSDLERLQGHRDIYSIRINDTERLLFTFWELNGKRYLVVLDYLPTHDYDGSRFLQHGFLKKYKLRHQEAMEEAALQFENAKERLPEITPVSGPTKPLMAYQQQWIHLSDEQFEAVHTALPVLIQGPAGSGKSCVAFSILENYIESHRVTPLEGAGPAEPSVKKLLYVTQSALLKEKMQAQWFEAHPEEEGFEVHFKTYEELLAEHQADSSKSIKAHKEVLQVWIEKTKIKIKKEILHQEFLICSAYSQEDYLQLGARQSLLAHPEERKALYAAYLRFIDYLNQNHIALNTLEPFKKPALEQQYDIVVADESQDLSNKQRENLITLEKEGLNLAFLMDMNQSLNGLLTSSFFLKGYFYKAHGHALLNEVQLKTCYRCPPAIAHLADKIIKAKNMVTGGLADSKEAAEILAYGQDLLGQVIQIEPQEIPAWEWLEQQHQQAHCVIITSEEFLEEASQFFPRERLFTAESIKGLEYDLVILYKPFSDPKLLEAIKSLPSEWNERQTIMHRPSQGSANMHQALPFNHLFTAITRAKQTLVLCDTARHENVPLLNPIQRLYRHYKEVDDSQLEQHISSIADWKDEIKRLYLVEGNTPRLQALFKQHVCESTQSFQDFIQILQPQPVTPLITRQATPVKADIKPSPPKVSLKPAPKPNPKVVPAKARAPAVQLAIPSAKISSRIQVAKAAAPRFRKKGVKTTCIPFLIDYSGPDLLEVFQKAQDDSAINLLFGRLGCLYNEEYNILFHLANSKEKDTLIQGLMHLSFTIQRLPRKKEQFELQLLNLLLSNDYILLLLSQTPKGASYISDLFEKPLVQINTELKARFIKNIYKVHAHPTSLQNTSVLFFLIKNAGHEAKFLIAIFFSHLEEGNPYKKDAFKALYALRQSEPEEKTHNTSSLYWLCKLIEWRPQIIRLMHTSNLHKKEEFINALCARLTAQTEHDENYSALFFLCFSEELIPSIIEFIDKNRLFERKVFRETLCARTHQNASLLYWLCSSSNLRPQMLRLIKEFDLFKDKAFLTAFLYREKETPISENVSVFYLFCESPELHAQLLEFIKETNLFQEEEFRQTLCARRNAASGRFENISPLYLLITYSLSSEIMEWIKNPVIREKEYFITTLCAERSAEAEEYEGFSIIALLFNHPEAKKIMLEIILETKALRENSSVQRLISPKSHPHAFFQRAASTTDLEPVRSPIPN